VKKLLNPNGRPYSFTTTGSFLAVLPLLHTYVPLSSRLPGTVLSRTYATRKATTMFSDNTVSSAKFTCTHTRITFAHYIVNTFAPLDIPISIDCSLFLLHLPAVQDVGHEALFSTAMRVQRRLVPFGIWCLLDH